MNVVARCQGPGRRTSAFCIPSSTIKKEGSQKRQRDIEPVAVDDLDAVGDGDLETTAGRRSSGSTLDNSRSRFRRPSSTRKQDPHTAPVPVDDLNAVGGVDLGTTAGHWALSSALDSDSRDLMQRVVRDQGPAGEEQRLAVRRERFREDLHLLVAEHPRYKDAIVRLDIREEFDLKLVSCFLERLTQPRPRGRGAIGIGKLKELRDRIKNFLDNTSGHGLEHLFIDGHPTTSAGEIVALLDIVKNGGLEEIFEGRHNCFIFDEHGRGSINGVQFSARDCRHLGQCDLVCHLFVAEMLGPLFHGKLTLQRHYSTVEAVLGDCLHRPDLANLLSKNTTLKALYLKTQRKFEEMSSRGNFVTFMWLDDFSSTLRPTNMGCLNQLLVYPTDWVTIPDS